MDEDRSQYDDGHAGDSTMVIAYGAVAFCGAIVGALLMWVIMV